jgi:glycosyltransferase involved in cell wall biosynthesis
LKSPRTRLTLDARKAYDSGIGTYIRCLIPYLRQEFDLKLIGSAEKLTLFDCPIIPTDSQAYSLSDFYLPSQLAGKTDVFWTPHFNFPLFPPKARLKVTTVYDLYHKAHWDLLSFQQKVVYNLFLWNLVRATDLSFTISHFTKEEIARFYPALLAKTEVIHLGIDFEMFNTTPPVVGMEAIKAKYRLPERYLLFVGNLKPNKNVITLLKAMKMLVDEGKTNGRKVVLTGKNEGFRIGDNEAIDFIRENNLTEHVVFTGFVENEDLPSLYQCADLFVFPSLYEGFGFPPLEAIACHCPVVCSQSASIPEVCEDKVFYFNGEQPAELKALLARLLYDDVARTSKVMEAASWVRKYDWGLTAEAHIRSIKDKLATKA